MKSSILPQGEKYIRNRRFHSRLKKLMLILGAVVVFCTTYALILPAITMESKCQIPEHTHTDACYTQVVPVRKNLICTSETLGIHRHTGSCKDAEGKLVCGYADFVVHVHDAACYDEDGHLWCPLPEIREHRHDDSCYAPVETHIHDESCYIQERGELTCAQHEHTDACWTDVKILACGQEETSGHQHDDSCLTVTETLVCGLAESNGHQHTDDCRDENGDLVCGMEESSGHHHSSDCYTQHTEITCGKEESSGHQHSEACYQPSRELICGIDSDHQHTDECYNMIDVLICGKEETSEADAAEPICGKKEAILHRHTDGCFDRYGILTCDKIQVLAHQHDDACFAEAEDSEAANVLTCTDTDENHVHTPRCYGTWVLTCGMTEHTHTEACYTSAEEPVPSGDASEGENDADNASDAVPENPSDTAAPDIPADTAVPEEPSNTVAPEEPSDTAAPENPLDSIAPVEPSDTAEPEGVTYAAAGTLNVTLLYGDEQPQSAHPDGVYYYTHTTMSGYLKLEPSGLETDLADVTVTLSIPKQYVEKDSVKIPEFNTNSSATEYEILPVEEDDGYYYARIHFTTYDKTQTLELPFLLSFMGDVVPDNYVLPITVSVSAGNTTEPSYYRPQYKAWFIEKYVNSNR